MSLLDQLKMKRENVEIVLHNLQVRLNDLAESAALAEADKNHALGELSDIDKAIAALEPSSGGLLDDQPEAASPEFASEQSKPIEEMIATSEAICEELSEAYTPPVAYVESTTSAFKQGAAAYASGTPVTDLPTSLEGEWERTWVNGWWDAHDKDMAADWTVKPSEAESELDSQETAPATIEQSENLPPGIEYRIDGGRLQTTGEPKPEAAYAPVNEDEGLMWANGKDRERELIAEAEEPEAKRPFWMFRPKVDA